MTAAALRPFLEVAQRDAALFNIAQLVASQVRWWLVLVLRVLLFPIAIVLAQAVPFIFRRHLALLLPRLPEVHNPADLAWVKDALLLYHESLKLYARYCLFRRQAHDMLDEIDEQIDSLQFVADHRDFLDKAVAHIEQR